MNTQELKTYLVNKQKQETTPFIINNNGGFYICKGELIPMKEFNEVLFPLGDKIRTLHAGQHKGEAIGSAGI